MEVGAQIRSYGYHVERQQQVKVDAEREMARPERFELPTPRFEAWCSIQLSYGRRKAGKIR